MLLKIHLILCPIGHDEICNDRQIGIPTVQESSFPVHQPQAQSSSGEPVKQRKRTPEPKAFQRRMWAGDVKPE